jgi:hypothetical protein
MWLKKRRDVFGFSGAFVLFFTLILLIFAGHCFKLYSAYARSV